MTTCVEKVHTFIWKIENFSMLPQRKGQLLESPKFFIESLSKALFFLRLYPKGSESDDLSLCLVTELTTSITTKLNYTLAVEFVNNTFEESSSSVIISPNGIVKIISKSLELEFTDDMNLSLPHDILTIRCHIWHSEEQSNVPANTINPTTLSNYIEKRYSARTVVDVQKRVLTWPITKSKRYSSQDISIDLESSSDPENIPDPENSPEDYFVLKLSYGVDKTMNDNHAQIEICQTRSRTNQRLLAKCKITVASADEEHQTSHEGYHLFSSNLDEVWHFPDFILIDNIEEYTYVDDTMFLQFDFTFSLGKIHHSELPVYMPNDFQEKGIIEFAQSLLNLFVREKFCDMEIRVGKQTFPCHKLILCARSPMFTAMFENDTKERETGVVEITDFEPEIVGKFLNFLYSEVIPNGLTVEEICDLYSAADKYEVLLLQRRCSLLLLSKLSVKIIHKVLVTADSHQDHFLWINAYNFLRHYSREVYHSHEWKTFMDDNPILSEKIMIKICMEEPY